ncbi:hypothetical protein [Verrucomicrobium spinosum]|uniref:hypothetical protein n=1 Tax=Verrucomicrobium spinosum TaxID=2736 RepID=UPI000AB5BE96|nr:hypothetical protein [Verrucomicrobium spinosum]
MKSILMIVAAVLGTLLCLTSCETVQESAPPTRTTTTTTTEQTTYRSPSVGVTETQTVRAY